MRSASAYCVARPWDMSAQCNPPDPVVLFSPGGSGSTRYGGSDLNEADVIRQSIAQLDATYADRQFYRPYLAQRRKLMRQLARVKKKYGLSGMGEVTGLSVVGWLVAGYVLYKVLKKGR